MKLLLDETYPRRLAEQLRQAGHDVVAVVERSEPLGRADLEVARRARDEVRVVVTEDVVDFVGLDGADHAGVLLVHARRWPPAEWDRADRRRARCVGSWTSVSAVPLECGGSDRFWLGRGMRADIAEVIRRIRASRHPGLLRLLAAAGLGDDRAPEPWPDVVEPYRWFLQRIGDGVKLTGAGYLPPSVVLETMQQLGWDADWIGKGNREDMTPHVAELRETARRLGLVRVYRGELRCTTAGARFRDDSTGLWWHIAAHLPLGRSDAERQAGLLFLLTVAAGAAESRALVAQGLWELGWGDSGTQRPVTERRAFFAYRDTWAVLDRLGVLGRRRGAGEEPTPAGVELARAVLLAPEPEAPRRRANPVPALELEVELRDVEPRVWRRIVVPETTTLRQLHALLQAAMGWENRHLYLFVFADGDYGDVEDMELGAVSTKLAQLVEPGGEFRYDYDFGDGWEHDVRVLRRTAADGAHCLDGGGACPPEDCGGASGYERLLEILADPAHPEHAELAEWLGRPFDAAAFAPAGADAAMQRAARR